MTPLNKLFFKKKKKDFIWSKKNTLSDCGAKKIQISVMVCLKWYKSGIIHERLWQCRARSLRFQLHREIAKPPDCDAMPVTPITYSLGDKHWWLTPNKTVCAGRSLRGVLRQDSGSRRSHMSMLTLLRSTVENNYHEGMANAPASLSLTNDHPSWSELPNMCRSQRWVCRKFCR